jgi:Ca2+-binding EF-hand superfamily protein
MRVDNTNNGASTGRGASNRIAELLLKYSSGEATKVGSGNGASSRIIRPEMPKIGDLRGDNELFHYFWGSETDILARTIPAVLETQENKLNSAKNFHKNRISELDKWIKQEAEMREVTDNELRLNRSYRWLSNRALIFYNEETDYHNRVVDKLKTVNLDPQQTQKFLQHFNQLDNLRDAYDKVLQNLDLPKRLDYGNEGYIRLLELEKSKDSIEQVLLKGASVEELELYERVYDDEINAVINMRKAQQEGDKEKALFWDLLAATSKKLRVDFLNKTFDKYNDPESSQSQIKSSLEFFESNYSVLMGRVKDSMMLRLDQGAKLSDLNDSDSLESSLREQFDFLVDDLLDNSVNNKSISQIMSERATRVLDRDRDGNVKDNEVVSALIESQKALIMFEEEGILDFRFDLNNDGVIDAEDIQYLRQSMEEHNKLFSIIDRAKSLIDTNNDGILSNEELLAVFDNFRTRDLNDENRNFLFDLNGDGKLDYNNDFRILTHFLAHYEKDHETDDSEKTLSQVMLENLSTVKDRLSDVIDFANFSMDTFDELGGESIQLRNFHYTNTLRANIVKNQNQNIANYIAYHTFLRAMSPNRLQKDSEEEKLYIEKLNSMNDYFGEYTNSYLDRENWHKSSQPLSWASWKDRLSTTILYQRSGKVEDVERMDQLADMVIKLHTDRNNYLLGIDIDLQRFVADQGTSTNPDLIKSRLMADFSAQHYLGFYQLVPLMLTSVGKVDNEAFNLEFEKLIQAHQAAKESLLLRLGEPGISLEDPAIMEINEIFFTQQEKVAALLKG